MNKKTSVSLSRRERESINLIARARELRRQSSDAEQLLWRHLRARRLMGFKLRRQMVIEPCIVDFVCLEADGGQHSGQVNYDDMRMASSKAWDIGSCVSETTR